METKEKKIPLIKQSASFKIIIPAEVERQIRFLCERVWDTEWSGVLFYTPSGDFADGSLEIRCVDIFPMDIGNATYTEFNMSPDVIGYMAQKPELLDCKMGLIHSHNNMSTFFSSTDTNTLLEEGNERNHFVSLIVNNAGKYTAAITRKVKYHSVRELSYEGFDGPVTLADKEVIEGEEIEYFNLDIVFEDEQSDSIKEIAERLSEIKKAKAAAPKTYSPGWVNPAWKNPVAGSPVKTTTNIHKPYPSLFEEDDDDWGGHYGRQTVIETPSKPKSAPKTVKEEVPTDPIFTDEDIEKALTQLITGSVTVTKVDKDTKQKLIKTMETRFDNRFNKHDPALTLFEYWATDFIEFLLWYSVDEADIDECLAAEELATKLVAAFEKLPNNKYIDKYIELLTKYATKF